jgi:Fe-Mn family superoxide dismutase
MTRFFYLLLLPILLSATQPAAKPFQAKDFSNLMGMKGFEDKPLQIHMKLYQGYVKRTNDLSALLQSLDPSSEPSSTYFSEIKRRFMWEYDGMRLHELYFGNLTKQPTALDPNSALYKTLVEQFGSYQKWESDFKATGLMRGIGWVVLIWDPQAQRLSNTWIAEHEQGHLPGGIPLLIMDVWEHAFMIQWGLDRPGYIAAFFNNINWPVVEKRFSHEE